jgi:hypothetical protein
MSERPSLVALLPDLGAGVSFYQALGFALEALSKEEALLAPKEGPLLLLRPGEGGFARGPYLPAPEGAGFARVLGLEEGRLVLLAEPRQEALRLRKYGLEARDLGGALLLFDPGGNPVLIRGGAGKEAGGGSQSPDW